jgi:tetratricopeptide (TPR) repeat protein
MSLSSPLDEIIMLGNGKSERVHRIDFEYHVQTIATSSQDILGVQMRALKLQMGQAAIGLQQLEQQRQSNAALQVMSAELSAISSGINALCQESQQTREAINAFAESMQASMDHISEQLYELKQELEEIAQVLRKPYETKARELREEADKWLTVGMKRLGRDRTEDFKDAMNLLEATVGNPIGKQDYVAWFQIGWILWKDGARLAEAEEAFYRSQRLSEPEANAWYIKGVRHLAHMQYLQGNLKDAVATIEKATLTRDSISAAADPEAAYEAAKYYARTRQPEKMLAELEWALRHCPDWVVTMYADADIDGDFYQYADLLLKLHGRLALESMGNFIARMENAKAVLAVAEAGRATGMFTIRIPDSAVAVIENAANAPSDDFDMLGYMDAEVRVSIATDEIIDAIVASLRAKQGEILYKVMEEERRSAQATSSVVDAIRHAEAKKTKYSAGVLEKVVATLSLPVLKKQLEDRRLIEEGRLAPFRQQQDRVDAAATALISKAEQHYLGKTTIPRKRLAPRAG